MGNPTLGGRPRRIESLQVLRGVAALFVLLLHTATTLQKYGEPGDDFFRSFPVGHAGVDLFFVISGFIMVLTTGPRRGADVAWGFLKRRAVRIYPTYWVYLALVLVVQAVRPAWVNASVEQQAGVLPSIFLLPAAGTPWLQVAWTLEYEIVFYVLFALLLLGGTRRLLGPLLGVLILLVAVGRGIAFEADWLRLLTGPMMLEFAMGAAGAGAYRSGRAHAALALAGVALLVAEAAGFNWVAALDVPGGFVRPLAYGMPAALIVVGLAEWERERRPAWPRFTLAVGDASYTLYLSHLFVLAAVGRLWRAAGLHVLPDALLAVALVVFPVAFALVAYRWVERPMVEWGARVAKGRVIAGGVEGASPTRP